MRCNCTGTTHPRIDPRAGRAHTLPMVKKSAPEASPVAQFEQSLEELEQLVDTMEHGELTLEQAELRVRQLADPAQPESATAFDPLPDAGRDGI